MAHSLVKKPACCPYFRSPCLLACRPPLAFRPVVVDCHCYYYAVLGWMEIRKDFATEPALGSSLGTTYRVAFRRPRTRTTGRAKGGTSSSSFGRKMLLLRNGVVSSFSQMMIGNDFWVILDWWGVMTRMMMNFEELPCFPWTLFLTRWNERGIKNHKNPWRLESGEARFSPTTKMLVPLRMGR